MNDYMVRLVGPAVRNGRLPGAALAGLLPALHRGAEGAVRIRLEGRSRARGATPDWLRRAAAFDLVEYVREDGGLRLEAPSLREAVPERFAQHALFEEVDTERTGLSFVSEALEDAVGGDANSDAFDDGLLKVFERLRPVLQGGVTEIEIRNARPDHPPVRITEEGVARIHDLVGRTPAPQRVRLAGWVNEIRHDERGFSLVLPDGRSVRGHLVGGEADTLKSLWGKKAVVSGQARFRPSGAIHHIEADRLSGASPEDLDIWGEVPEPFDRELDPRALRKPQGPRSGVNAIIGTWPDDTPEDEIFRILEELS